MSVAPDAIFHVYVVAGEHSGDQLGFKLMQALRAATGGHVRFSGVGGHMMEAEGLKSLFPISDIAVMGIVPVLKRLPQVLARIRETAADAIAAKPDALVIIDSPDFTHRVAKKVRAALRDLPVIDYVSPTVWAWRPGRARTMRGYIDHVLALLPFEPAAHRRLGGPACTYVGHPLIERLEELRPNAAEATARERSPPQVLILPGSRRLEIERLMDDFRAAAELMTSAAGPIDFVLPAVDHLVDRISAHLETWAVKPRIVRGEAAKFEAFRSSRAALAASGTVTLELALSGVPMVVAYRVSRVEELLRFLIKVPSIVLPNLILGRNAIPEFIQHDCTPDALAAAMLPLVVGGAARDVQVAALSRLDGLMGLPAGDTPSARAARVILDVAGVDVRTI